LELLTLFAKYGGWRALYAGSSSEYEARSGGMREDGGARAMSPYGLCKRSLTDAAIPCAEGFGASLAVARFFTIYGEDDAHDYGAIPSAIRSLSRGEPVVCRSPMAIRDYVYAGDAARAAVAILERDFRGTVNVASGRPRFVREVFTIVAEETGRPDLLTFDEKNTATDILAADVSRLNDELGITCGTELREGIRRCVSAITKRRRSV
jgi:nucleoside-diphosphate-sugar epimerase